MRLLAALGCSGLTFKAFSHADLRAMLVERFGAEDAHVGRPVRLVLPLNRILRRDEGLGIERPRKARGRVIAKKSFFRSRRPTRRSTVRRWSRTPRSRASRFTSSGIDKAGSVARCVSRNSTTSGVHLTGPTRPGRASQSPAMPRRANRARRM
jgi:hypothetical protein